MEDLTVRADQPALSQDSGPILTVDEEEPLRRMCSQVLTAKGYEAHVVLLDLKIPVMGRLECLHCLRDTGCRAEIVMITGYSNEPSVLPTDPPISSDPPSSAHQERIRSFIASGAGLAGRV